MLWKVKGKIKIFFRTDRPVCHYFLMLISNREIRITAKRFRRLPATFYELDRKLKTLKSSKDFAEKTLWLIIVKYYINKSFLVIIDEFWDIESMKNLVSNAVISAILADIRSHLELRLFPSLKAFLRNAGFACYWKFWTQHVRRTQRCLRWDVFSNFLGRPKFFESAKVALNCYCFMSQSL